VKYRAFIGGMLLSHSIELPHTEGTEQTEELKLASAKKSQGI